MVPFLYKRDTSSIQRVKKDSGSSLATWNRKCCVRCSCWIDSFGESYAECRPRVKNIRMFWTNVQVILHWRSPLKLFIYAEYLQQNYKEKYKSDYLKNK